ncbi:MAG: phosphoglycerate kinase [Nanoarchaeota archaeon]
MALKTIDAFTIANKASLIRIDINSALHNGKILDSPRFFEHAKTITELLRKKAKVVIIAHQGRSGDADCISLEKHAILLAKHIHHPVQFVPDVFGLKAKKAITNLLSGQVLLLENIRFYSDEKNLGRGNRYPAFCKLFDLYINDAFSVSHREQGSIVLPPKYLSSMIGRSFEHELKAADHFLKNESQKKVFLLGGSKLEDYLPFFKVLHNPHHKILASGVLANAFLASQDIDLGYENGWLKSKGYQKLYPQLKALLQKYSQQIILPVDFAFGERKRKEMPLAEAPFNEKIWDIGSTSIALFKEHLTHANAIFVKGPLGYSENPLFSNGTVDILKYISYLTQRKNIYSLLGGGHLTTTITTYKIPNHFSSISLSGGALMAYLVGKKLPGLEALKIK